MITIPPQKDGGFSDNEHEKILGSTWEAKQQFDWASKKLFDINKWSEWCENMLSANFSLYNKYGHPVKRLAELHDYVKIDIPGPGSIDGGGFDWVQIKNISVIHDPENDTETAFLQVSPCSCPVNSEPHVAHFFSTEATSTFMIQREGKKVRAEIHGRNEKPNTSGNTIDSLRNTFVAKLAKAAFSDLQWKDLCKGFLY